jgi:hypothetical protein
MQEPHMNSRVELVIDAEQAEVAELFADPRNNIRWMDDIARIEPISGELGRPGSVYRLVPKRGALVFVARVVRRALPGELRLSLQARRVAVSATDTFCRLSDGRTKLISEEVFTFQGVFSKVVGFFGRRSIAGAHRRHMDLFKRFAETQLGRHAR